MPFNTPRGDTSPRDMAERCLGIGYDCMDGLGWDLGWMNGTNPMAETQ